MNIIDILFLSFIVYLAVLLVILYFKYSTMYEDVVVSVIKEEIDETVFNEEANFEQYRSYFLNLQNQLFSVFKHYCDLITEENKKSYVVFRISSPWWELAGMKEKPAQNEIINLAKSIKANKGE